MHSLLTEWNLKAFYVLNFILFFSNIRVAMKSKQRQFMVQIKLKQHYVSLTKQSILVNNNMRLNALSSSDVSWSAVSSMSSFSPPICRLACCMANIFMATICMRMCDGKLCDVTCAGKACSNFSLKNDALSSSVK